MAWTMQILLPGHVRAQRACGGGGGGGGGGGARARARAKAQLKKRAKLIHPDQKIDRDSK